MSPCRKKSQVFWVSQSSIREQSVEHHKMETVEENQIWMSEWKDSIYSTYIIFSSLSQLYCSPRHLLHANYLRPTFRVLQSSGQNQTILASVELGLLCVFWDHWVDWDSKTTVCKVCTDRLPPTQLWLHCASSGAFAWVAPNDRYHYKAR